MTIPSVITDLSSTAASNSPLGSESIGSNLDNYLRAIQSIQRIESKDYEWTKQEYTHTYASGTSFTIAGTDVTAIYAANRRIRAVGSSTGTIYGTISSSSFSTNTTVNITWDSGSLSNESLTVSLGLHVSNVSYPNITTAKITDDAVTTSKIADDAVTTAKISDTLFNGLTAKSGIATTDSLAIVDSAASDVNKIITWANLISSKALQEAAASAVKIVTPSIQQHHPSAAKHWVNFNGTGTIAIRASYNTDSLVDEGTGDYTVNIDTDFAADTFCLVGLGGSTITTGANDMSFFEYSPSRAAGSYRVKTGDSGLAKDYPIVCMAAFGAQ